MAYNAEELNGLTGWQLPKSTKKGLIFPKMTTTEKNAQTVTTEGAVVYDTVLKKLYCWDGTTWNALW